VLPPGSLPAGYTAGPILGGQAGRTLVVSALDACGAPCALKFLDPRGPVDELAVARFAAEQQRHGRAAHCAHVLPVQRGVPAQWLGLAWAHGGSLDQRLATGRGFTRSRVHDLLRALLEACVDLHAIGIVHRDIKPSNILLDADEFWLSDFGVAAALGPDGHWQALPAPWRETSVGTSGWTAPELCDDPSAIAPANDLYGVGRVWEALDVHTGQADPDTAAELRAALCERRPGDRPSAAAALAFLAPGCA